MPSELKYIILDIKLFFTLSSKTRSEIMQNFLSIEIQNSKKELLFYQDNPRTAKHADEIRKEIIQCEERLQDIKQKYRDLH